jgi:hypothetical protein
VRVVVCADSAGPAVSDRSLDNIEASVWAVLSTGTFYRSPDLEV